MYKVFTNLGCMKGEYRYLPNTFIVWSGYICSISLCTICYKWKAVCIFITYRSHYLIFAIANGHVRVLGKFGFVRTNSSKYALSTVSVVEWSFRRSALYKTECHHFDKDSSGSAIDYEYDRNRAPMKKELHPVWRIPTRMDPTAMVSRKEKFIYACRVPSFFHLVCMDSRPIHA